MSLGLAREILEKTNDQTPALEDVIDQVRLDWIAIEEEQLLNAEIEKLRLSYTVEIVAGGHAVE